MLLSLFFVIGFMFHVTLANMPADPRPFRMQQPNGDWISLQFNGDAEFHYLTDVNGYTVTNDNGYNVYAELDEETGLLVSTGKRVGKVDPSRIGLKKKILPYEETIKQSCGEFCDEIVETREDYDRRRKLLSSDGVLKNLVILICFDDHKISDQPTESDYDVLFNSEGVDALFNKDGSSIARTGSIKDVLLKSSYGNLKLESTVYRWIKVSKPSTYYTNGNSGLSTRLHEAMSEALDIIDSEGFDWLEFDQDRDGNIDAITFLHSGYGAEFGGYDCHEKFDVDRIWSHKWAMQPWNSRRIDSRRVVVSRYHISPGKWGTCGDTITRIGVIAHELGHFLGLEDHYDGYVGVGIGNYGLMGNAWGFDFSQEYPPMMNPWSKIQLGWLEPIIISESKTYKIPSSAEKPVIYKIEEGYPDGEYLLIENRQPKGYDKKMPQGGLIIWHVDEKAGVETEGFPTQSDWPQNGNHYKVALLQADGQYNLEMGLNHGDSDDAFHAGGVHSIGPSGTSNGNYYPNTNSYQGGKIYSTGHIISDISSSGDMMSFRLSNRLRDMKQVETTFRGGNGQTGIMFDVIPNKDLSIFSIDVHTTSTDLIEVQVWSKEGTWEGHDTSSNAWTLKGTQTVRGQGYGEKTPVEGFDEIFMEKDTTHALYITTDDEPLLYSNGKTLKTAAIDENLSILVGAGKKYPFSTVTANRIWNGCLRYQLV